MSSPLCWNSFKKTAHVLNMPAEVSTMANSSLYLFFHPLVIMNSGRKWGGGAFVKMFHQKCPNSLHPQECFSLSNTMGQTVRQVKCSKTTASINGGHSCMCRYTVTSSTRQLPNKSPVFYVGILDIKGLLSDSKECSFCLQTVFHFSGLETISLWFIYELFSTGMLSLII